MEKQSVLFVCVHNAARSQMAEAYLKELGGDMFIAESAGFEPGEINPIAVAAMEDAGIDIMNNKTKSVFKMAHDGKAFDYVITVCDESQGQQCPTFAGGGVRLHWSFEDPYGLQELPYDEALRKTKAIRDAIREKITTFISEQKSKQGE